VDLIKVFLQNHTRTVRETYIRFKKKSGMIQGRPPLTVLFNFFSDSMTTEQAQKQQDESDRQRLLFAMTPTPITTSLYTLDTRAGRCTVVRWGQQSTHTNIE